MVGVKGACHGEVSLENGVCQFEFADGFVRACRFGADRRAAARLLLGRAFAADRAGGPPWWWDNLAAQSHALQQAGFTYIWLPPVVKGANAHYSVGYDPFDDYDIGSKDQHGFVSSRYGTREQLERCVAMLRANGLNVVLDLVENHRDGDTNLFFNYKDAFGNPTGGRFAKTPDDFHQGSIAQDPDVPEETGNQIGMFGPDLAPINGKNHHAFDGLIDAGDWLTRALDAQGYRLDYVKGISTDWLLPFLNSKAMKGKWAVGEFFDGRSGQSVPLGTRQHEEPGQRLRLSSARPAQADVRPEWRVRHAAPGSCRTGGQ